MGWYRLHWILLACCWVACHHPPEEPLSANDAESDEKNTDNPRPQPASATDWQLEALLLSNPQPTAQELSVCLVRVSAIAQDADNDDALLHSLKELEGMLQQDLNLYHWCYYQMLHKLSLELGQEGMPFDKKGDYFYLTMKKLWLIAKSLEDWTKDPTYYKFLKSKYLELSKQIFGRDLTPIAPSLDQRRIPSQEPTVVPDLP